MDKEKALRNKITLLTKKYAALKRSERRFIPGKTKISYSGRVYNEKEMVNLINASLDFWLTDGPYSEQLENNFKRFFNSKGFILVNSGSSANLTMVSALASSQLLGQLHPGDEIITTALTFPTTLAPIVQNGFVPVFVDVKLENYNIDPSKIEQAIGKKTKAMFIPHTLGNPANMDVIIKIAKKYGLFLLEDNCDALGATYDDKLTGTFGDLASLSFYPAHQMTMGEGGGVIVNNPLFVRIGKSIRDWGRDCWCKPGFNNTCRRRFEGTWGKLPFGYDHKYVYSHIGYNLKITDLQASIGLAQFDKIPYLVKKRRQNFQLLYDGLKKYQDHIILPQWEKKANPSWFGFPITVKEHIDRRKLTLFLESHNIETRLVFAGNILRQPGFINIKHRISDNLKNTDEVMRRTFFIGVYAGITPKMIEFILEYFQQFFNKQ